MKPESTNAVDVLPFLTTFSTPRTGTDDLPGHYDPTAQVWMVETLGGRLPIIRSLAAVSELATKTRQVHEQDDPGDIALLESATKTFTVPEQDDFAGTELYSLVELATKTEVRPERDD